MITIGKIKAKNFCSYKELEFDFSNVGLALIWGPTGSGKSTFQDIIPWVLYGYTAKEGNVDEVIPFKSKEQTEGSCEVLLGSGSTIRIRRCRRPNDLYIEQSNGEIVRGKDLLDTQKIIDSLIGVTCEVFIASTYFHEFSTSGRFFEAKTKERKEFLEGLSDLSLCCSLEESLKERKRSTKERIKTLDDTSISISSRRSQFSTILSGLFERQSSWEGKNSKEIEYLQEKSEGFEKEKQQKIEKIKKDLGAWEELQLSVLNNLESEKAEYKEKLIPKTSIDRIIKEVKEKLKSVSSSPCPTCGNPKNIESINNFNSQLRYAEDCQKQNTNNLKQIQILEDTICSKTADNNPNLSLLSECETQQNVYREQLDYKLLQESPYIDDLNSHSLNLEMLDTSLLICEKSLECEKGFLTACSQLEDVNQMLRETLLSNKILEVQNGTNDFLEKYFDGEFRIDIKDDLSILKDGNLCNYKQLSKGQRQLLKLCFSISTMKAYTNKSGVMFTCVLFDEALDGLDSSLKVKAYSLFQELAIGVPSVLVIDHSSELQQLFDTRYQVELTPSGSVLCGV